MKDLIFPAKFSSDVRVSFPPLLPNVESKEKKNHEKNQVWEMRHYNRCHGNHKVIMKCLEQSCTSKTVKIYNLLRQNYEKNTVFEQI